MIPTQQDKVVHGARSALAHAGVVHVVKLPDNRLSRSELAAACSAHANLSAHTRVVALDNGVTDFRGYRVFMRHTRTVSYQISPCKRMFSTTRKPIHSATWLTTPLPQASARVASLLRSRSGCSMHAPLVRRCWPKTPEDEKAVRVLKRPSSVHASKNPDRWFRSFLRNIRIGPSSELGTFTGR